MLGVVTPPLSTLAAMLLAFRLPPLPLQASCEGLVARMSFGPFKLKRMLRLVRCWSAG